jgi:hypothetical protein
MSAIADIFSRDEGLDDLAKVTIQPIGHAFWLHEPGFGFGGLIRVKKCNI